MDETDVVLCQLLMMAPRTPYRDLADKLGISVAAVHKRVEALQAEGVLKGFRAHLSLSQVRAVPVLVVGRSGTTDSGAAAQAILRDDRTYAVLAASGNLLYIGAYLHGPDELDSYTGWVVRTAEMEGPEALMESTEPPGGARARANQPRPLSGIDRRIIQALHRDCRKPLVQVAEETRLSVKTVRRHFEAMIEDGAVELTVEWNPDASGDIVAFVHLGLAEGTDANYAGRHLMGSLRPHAVFYRTFSNRPDMIIVILWANSMGAVQRMLEQTKASGLVRTLEANFVYSGRRQDTWRDQEIAGNGSGAVREGG